MPFNKSKLLIVAAAIACTGTVAVLVYLRTLRVQAYRPEESAKLVPDEALMATFISPDSSSLQYLKRFGTGPTRNQLDRILSNFKRQSLAGTPLNFDRDLKPWMGGLMVSVLPPEDPEQGGDSHLLMILAIRNRFKASQLANRLNSQTGIRHQERDYRGVAISQYTEESGKRYSIATVGDRVLVAATADPIERAIDTLRGEPSLADIWGTEDLFFGDIAVPNPLMTIFIADYAGFVEQTAELSGESWRSWGSFSRLTPVESVAIGVGVDGEGLRLKGVMRLQPPPTSPESPPEVGELVARFPSETIALVNSQGIDRLWSQLVAQAPENPPVRDFVRQVRRGLQALDLDADGEVFGWMDGEFALGAIASDDGILAPLGLGGVLLLETGDRPQADATLDRLDAIVAESNPPVDVERRIIQGVEVTEWNDPEQGTLFGHGWLTPDTLFVAFGGPVVETIALVPNPTLPENPRFQSITQSLPQANHSYVYLDMEHLVSWATGYLLAAPAVAVEPKTLTLLNSIRGVGISAARPTSDRIEVEVLLALKAKRN